VEGRPRETILDSFERAQIWIQYALSISYFQPETNCTNTEKGCALRIQLSPHSIRVYSSDTKYETIAEAKAICAKVALEQDVLDYIKRGNGQVEPEKSSIYMSDGDADTQETATNATYTPPAPLTLQAFYGTFPQPFPENFGDKSAVEINAPSWLNTAIQGARGGKLSSHFIWTTNGTLWGGSLGRKRIYIF
jgi:hypothetical protein